MAKPTVSVIMANYNAADHLPAALQSVLSQSISDIEVLLSDDASTDGSIKIARQFAMQDPRLKVILTLQNAGPGAARNRALKQARGEWIAIVDSDDIIHPQRFERMMRAAADLGTDAIADDLTYLIENQAQSGATLLGSMMQTAPLELTLKSFVAPSENAPKLGYIKALIRRDVLQGLTYREDIRVGEDHDFYVKFLLNGGRMHLLPQSLYLYRRHSVSISHRLHPDDIMAMIRAQNDVMAQYPDIPDDLRADMVARCSALQKPLAFETLAENLRRKRIGDAFVNIVRKPALLLWLGGVLKARAMRRIRPPKVQHKMLTDPSKWTLQEWAKITVPAARS
ncbi:MAG: glycosyltransferase [Pseudomonadota bacterium]